MVSPRMYKKHARKLLRSNVELVNNIRQEIADILHGQGIFVHWQSEEFRLRFDNQLFRFVDGSAERTSSHDFLPQTVQLIRVRTQQYFAETMMFCRLDHL